MLVELTDSVTGRPTAVNPDQVLYITHEPNETNKTRIRFSMGEKTFGHIVVEGDYAAVLAKLNGIKKRRAGAFKP
jgi:hypothetical protein